MDTQNKVKFFRFSLIGIVIFIIDANLYKLIINVLDSSLVARLISYSIATWFAWTLNKKYTFKVKNSKFYNYFLGASIAGIQNILISYFILRFLGNGNFIIYLSIGIGCLYGLLFNFIYQSKLTFAKYK
jgi:putative flippase GtrA